MNARRIALFPALAFAMTLGATAAFAQSAPAPAPAAPANTMAPAAKKAAPARTAASLACSTAADKQNLHGKPRKKFMSNCKHKGGPAN